MNTMIAIPEPADVIIVGAGISGIGMAAHLTQKCPGKSFAMIDRRERPGGTWDLFRYPGIRSDSDMFTLGFSFAPWRDARAIADGQSIRDYLDDVVATRGLRDHIRFGHTAASANWDSEAALWTVQLRDRAGRTSAQSGKFLYIGCGYYDYDQPHDAEIPGLDQFGGTVIHPQFWPDDFDWSGKRVVVIGSGATAVTLVPALADQAAHVTMLQRTPSWYLSRPSRDRIANALRRILPEKWAYGLIRARNVVMQDFLFKRSRAKPEAMRDFLTRQLQGELGEAYSARDFTPPYNPWEQRLCLVPDSDLFSAIKAGSADVVTGQIGTVDQGGIMLQDGRHIDADVIITATGLKLATMGGIAVSLDGTPVNFPQHYHYRNCMFSNVPNFAALFGYLNAGWTLRVDIVADWLCRLLRQMDTWRVDVATPRLSDDHDLIEDPIHDTFSSGYLQRGRHLMPKSATTQPWQLSMDYRADRLQMRDAPIDDGVLRFDRAAVCSNPPA
jgi:monooxygenase